jgi:hypothetical protein
LLAIQRQLALLLAGEGAGHLLGVGEPLCSSWVMVAASARALALTFCHASCCRAARLESMVSCWVCRPEYWLSRIRMTRAVVMATPASTRIRFWIERNCIARSLFVERYLTEVSAGGDSPATLPSKAEKRENFAILLKNSGFCGNPLFSLCLAWFSHPSLSVLKCDGFFNELAQGPLHKA